MQEAQPWTRRMASAETPVISKCCQAEDLGNSAFERRTRMRSVKDAGSRIAVIELQWG